MHHVADSHMNAFIRFKLALTEDNPTIKPYEESKWALQADYEVDPLISLKMLELIHIRWTSLLNSIEESDWNKTFFHPEGNQEFDLNLALALYSWHSRHHMAHFKLVAK
jgi:hypothetical protein